MVFIFRQAIMHQLGDFSTKCDLPIRRDKKVVKISEKAANTTNEPSKKRGLEIKVVPEQDTHTQCRHTFTNKKKY